MPDATNDCDRIEAVSRHKGGGYGQGHIAYGGIDPGHSQWLP